MAASAVAGAGVCTRRLWPQATRVWMGKHRQRSPQVSTPGHGRGDWDLHGGGTPTEHRIPSARRARPRTIACAPVRSCRPEWLSWAMWRLFEANFGRLRQWQVQLLHYRTALSQHAVVRRAAAAEHAKKEGARRNRIR